MKTKLSVLLLSLVVCFFLVFSFAQGFGDSVDLKKMAEKITKTLNSRDAAATANLYTEDAVYYEPNEPKSLRGRKAMEKNYANYFRAFPDIGVETKSVFVDGNHIIIEGEWSGTNTGPLATPEGELPATGHKIKIKFASIMRISSEGLIEEDRTYWDSASFMRQLGLME